MKFNHIRIFILGTLALAGVSCQSDVIVEEDIHPASISLSASTAELYEGETLQLIGTVLPENARDKTIEWTSNHPSAATVDENGCVTAIAAGHATISAVTRDGGHQARCRITVLRPVDPVIHVTGITLDKVSASLQVGQTLTLTATLEPADADDKVILWSSSESQVATVSNGTVTGITAGTTVITATTHEGEFKAQCTVKVKDPGEQKERWADTGADVPRYPTYNAVSNVEDFPRIDITWTTKPYKEWDGTFPYVDGTISFKDPKQMYSEVTELSNLKMRIRGRGNTTWGAEWGIKNPYRVKLETHNKVFGMKGDKDWILLPDVQDPSLLRNAVALRISRLVSMPWTPKYRAAEVYVNKEYYGCYLLVEAKEADRDNKVPVTVVSSGETDGGYYLEIDDKPDKDLYFRTSRFGKMIKYKDPENPEDAQRKFIENYVNEVERLLQEKKFSKEDGYWTKMEVSTFINQYIVQELTMNVDGNMRLSSYFAKDSDTKLFMPMCWDFDLSLGNCTYLGNDFDLPYYDGSRNGPKGWFVKIRGGYPNDYSYPKGKRDTYYQYLFMDPQFVAELKDRWNEVKPRLDMIPDFIDKMVQYNKLAYDHNSSANKNPRGNRGYYNPPDNFENWSQAVDWMKDFYQKRLEWLDLEINKL